MEHIPYQFYHHHNWKIILAVVIGLAIVASAFLSSSGLEGMSGFFTGASKSKNILISGEFETLGFNAEKVPAELILIKFSGDPMKFTIGENEWEVREGEIQIENYKGDISIAEGLISIKGKANKISTNSGTMASKEGLNIIFSDLKSDLVEINEISLRDFSNKGKGQVFINTNKVTFNLEQDELKLGAFEGDIALDDKLSIIGFTNSVSITGELSIGIKG